MRTREFHALQRHRDALLDELHQLPNLMRGNVYTRQRKCGRPSCTCATGGPRHPGLQMTVRVRGKSYARFIRQDERDAVEAMIAHHRRLREIVEELTEVNLALLHAELPTGGASR